MKVLSHILLPLFIFLSLNTQGSSLFTLKESVEINRPIADVYNMAANTINDALWRSEVHVIHSDGDFEIGTRYIEDAKLGIHRHYMTEVELVKINAPYEATYITVEENPFYLKSSRFFERISQKKTRFTYKVDIEKKMIKDIIGVQLPLTVIKPIYKAKMLKYMKNLKKILERKNHHSHLGE